ncbi:MAG: hypothetical protein GY952_06315 [Rhodobacteraceae bacterium]|nr:hypothetical protein [Paracoccaceae bacterium]
MERRDLLKFGIAAPFFLTPGIAQSGGNAVMESLKRQMSVHYSDRDDGEGERITTLFLYDDVVRYQQNLANFKLIDDLDSGGKLTATTALRGSSRIGRVVYVDNSLLATTNQIPQVRRAPLLIQVKYQQKSYTLSGTIRYRPLNARKSSQLPQPSQFRSQPEVADLHLNDETLILRTSRARSRYKFGVRLSF